MSTQQPIKISALQVENTKRIETIEFELQENGLVSIGGKNGQGKTSVLDSICWTLGGERFRPSSPDNESGGKAHTRIELSNGLVAERKGKNGSLKVTDPEGKKGGQQILDSLVEMLALDLPRFLHANDKQKAKTLLNILGVEEELQKLEEQENSLYKEREAHGKELDKARGYAEELPYYEDAPTEPVSTQELFNQRKAVQDKNAENQRIRDQVEKRKNEIQNEQQAADNCQTRIDELKAEIERLENQKAGHQKAVEEKQADLQSLEENAKSAIDQSTEDIDQQIQDAETTNEKVRANQEKLKARQRVEQLEEERKEYTRRINETRDKKLELLNGADMPLEGLSVENGELYYQGKAWDCMSSSDQLKVGTAIVQKLNPNCGFVLLDQLEKLDVDTLNEFAGWAEKQGLQIIGTRVSTGTENTLIIEDGKIKQDNTQYAGQTAENEGDTLF